jgi:hypothetical protein
MSDDGNFLARWSRRKRNTASETGELKPDNDGGDVASEASAPSELSSETKPPFDAASLPPIESIGAGSDIRAFLAAGVPAELTRAALRRVWLSDPKIRDFIGLSENSWDFNAPGAMAGFGPIHKEEAARVLTRLLEESDNTAAANSPPMSSQTAKAEASPSELRPVEKIQTMSSSTRPVLLGIQGPSDVTNTSDAVTERKKAHDVSQSKSTKLQQRSGHGSALPK